MKRAILIIIPILLAFSLIVFWVVNNHLEYKAQVKAKEAHKKRIEKNVISAVANLIKEYNAFDWVKELKGSKEIFDPILTVELEKLLLTDRPTLFIGEMKDIITFDQELYILKIEVICPYRTNLELAIKSPRQKVNSILKEHPNLTDDYRGGVAVVAKIDNIKVVDGKDNFRIGEGKSIDIIYVEDMHIWYY